MTPPSAAPQTEMHQRRITRLFVLSLLLTTIPLFLGACLLQPAPAHPPSAGFPNGVAAGDVDHTSVVLWARTALTGPVAFVVMTDEAEIMARAASLQIHPMQPVTVTATGLTPGADYRYVVTAPGGERTEGRFRTPALPDVHHGLRFGVSGDWRGSLAPFVAVRNVPDRDLDFFVALGDTVYADLASPAVPDRQAVTLEQFRRKHAEVYSNVGGLNTLADLRASTALFATIDDHEITNDFAGGADAARDSRFPEETGRINETGLYTRGLTAFQAFNPIAQLRYGPSELAPDDDGRSLDRPKLYRYRIFGLDAALFLLDARSFRDLPVRRPDRADPADVARFRADTFRPGRTMLGATQLADLKRDLLDAQHQGITWKFIIVPEPAQIRGLTSAQDRFEGYAAERTALLRFIAEQGIRNVVFVAADIHGTLVNNLTYSTGPDQPQIPIEAFEVTTGPVAYWATLGPVIIADGRSKGYVSESEAAAYAALPVANDPDSLPDDRDDFVKAIIDRELIAYGFDPIGLDNSAIDADLLQGDYVAFHTYGWTEFEIDAATQALTVTTYGIEPYVESDLDPAITDRVLEVVSRFRVMPRQ